MEEIIETSFTSVDLEKIKEFLTEVFANSVLMDVQLTSDDKIDVSSALDLRRVFSTPFEGSVYFHVSNFSYRNLSIDWAGIQVLKFESYDLNIDFRSDSKSSIGSISFLQQWSNSVALDLDAEEYYCGIEPAYDEETRFFTGNVLGPLTDW